MVVDRPKKKLMFPCGSSKEMWEILSSPQYVRLIFVSGWFVGGGGVLVFGVPFVSLELGIDLRVWVLLLQRDSTTHTNEYL